MKNFNELAKCRRSIRKYTSEQLNPEEVELLMKTALMSPTSKNSQSWEFILVDDKDKLARLALCKPYGSAFIEHSALSIAVGCDIEKSDVWIEDAAIASIMLQLQAEDMGLGSCWTQIRGRFTADGESSEDYIRNLLNIPPNIHILSVIAIGRKVDSKNPFDERNLLWEKLHLNEWSEPSNGFFA
ncbi:MAG: nitroreductase family protein [Candidatus Azobacteroides sp.]|nr:nitroreductase family protein [Candidatus Azobacteroides sp.]